MNLIQEQSHSGRRATAQAPRAKADLGGIPEPFRRKQAPRLPEVSEMQAVRHYTRLSQKNFSHRHPVLSAGFLHHEVQPARL